MRSIWLVLGIAVYVGNTGCGGGECLDGTVRHRDTCFPFDPFDKTPPTVTVDPAVRTRFVGNIKLVSDEPAEIYATIDDSAVTLDSPHEPDEMVIPNESNEVVLRYFAVDLAGNQSIEQIRLWNIDSTGPSPPSTFDLVLSNNQRSLSWANPTEADYQGVLVARVEGRLNVAPTSGTTYAVGDSIGPGVTVVQVSDTATTFDENLATTPGLVRYVAWAFDDLLNYGPPASDFALAPIPPQTGSLAISSTNGTVTQLLPASHITFSGSSTFDAGTLTAKITLRNDTSRVLFAPKVVVTNTLGAVDWTDSDGEVDSQPFRSFGGAIVPGGQVTTTWTFTNVTLGSLVALDFAFRDGPILLGSSGRGNTDHSGVVMDELTGLETDRLASGIPGTRGGKGTLGGGLTPDGMAVFGSRCSGTISSFDLQAGNRLLSRELRTQKSHVAHLAVDRGGVVGYALLAPGHLRNAYDGGGSAPTELVRFDVATLSEHGRIALGQSRNRDVRISPDGRFLAIASGVTVEGAIVVNLATYKVANRVIVAGRPDSVAFSPDSRRLAVVSNVELRVFDAGEGFTEIAKVPLPTGSSRVFRVAFATNDVLYVGRRDDSVKVDLVGSTAQVLSGLPRGRLLDVFGGTVYLGDQTLVRLDAEDSTDQVYSMDDQTHHWLGRSPF